jgi:hypothetical protein
MMPSSINVGRRPQELLVRGKSVEECVGDSVVGLPYLADEARNARQQEEVERRGMPT